MMNDVDVNKCLKKSNSFTYFTRKHCFLSYNIKLVQCSDSFLNPDLPGPLTPVILPSRNTTSRSDSPVKSLIDTLVHLLIWLPALSLIKIRSIFLNRSPKSKVVSNVLARFYKKRKKYNCKHYTNLVGIQIEITSDPYFGRMGKLYIKITIW